MHHEDRLIIGVGGHIGTGKTTTCKIFEDLGAHYISADEIGWEVLPDIADALEKRFGKIIMKKTAIDKKKLRDIVFSKKEHLQFLNRLSHPHLVKKILERLEKIKSGVVVIDAALLFDLPGVYERVDYPILVTADDTRKQERARAKGIDSVLFQKILDAQQSEQAMKQKAKYIIKNNGTMDALKEQCQTIYEEICNDC
jgi:dephospho-CoA kinase